MAETAPPGGPGGPKEPGRTAYEARFEEFQFSDALRGKRGDVLCWADLPPDGRAVWARVERECQKAAPSVTGVESDPTCGGNFPQEPCDCLLGDCKRSRMRCLADERTTPPAVTKASEGMGLGKAMEIAQRGYRVWAEKPHNLRWARKIDGTPIPNDLPIVIATAFVDAFAAAPAVAGVPEGWVLVPREPTKAMERAFCIAREAKSVDMWSPTPTEHPDDGGGLFGYGYRAMIAAAVQPELDPNQHAAALKRYRAGEGFIQPGPSRAGKPPCGECHLNPGETCDICGARAPEAPQPKREGI